MARPLKLTAQALALAVVAGLLALLVWKVVHGNGDSAASKISHGRRVAAPHFTLPRLDRPGRLALASLRGRPVVLNFWASWCVPCKHEASALEQTARRYRARGLVVLGVDAQDFSSDARHFMRRYGVTYPNVHDGPGSTLGHYGVTGFPETFFVDRRGRLAPFHIESGVNASSQNKQQFAAALAEILRS